MHTTNPYSQKVRNSGRLALVLGIGVLMAVPFAAMAKDAGYIDPHASRAGIAPGLVHTPMVEPDFKADLEKDFASLRKGQGQKAVSYFDKVIASADSWLANDPRPRRCVSQDGAQATVDVATIDVALCDAHFGRGYALIDMGRGDLAEADLRAATQMAPDNAHFANEYAELFKSRRDWTSAYALFDKAWSVADKTLGGPDADLAARALRGMGYAKEKMGDLAEAKRLIEQSLTYEPTSEAGRVQLAHVERMIAIGS